MNPTIESFYLKILDYAGLAYKDGIIVNKNEDLGELSIKGKHLTLPYMTNLKNPEGRAFFHLLNENYVNPENAVFSLYRKRLVTEINLKLINLFSILLEFSFRVGADAIKDNQILEMISTIEDPDPPMLEALIKLCRKSKDEHDEGLLIDLFIKKNASHKNVSHGALVKVQFKVYRDLVKALEDKQYQVYGLKLRKKDIQAFVALYNIVFPNINDDDLYTDVTDNKVFRYLMALLKGSYLITSKINHISTIIHGIEPKSYTKDDYMFNDEWVGLFDKLADMTTEIRLIPNQTDLTLEETKLVVDEEKFSHQQTTAEMGKASSRVLPDNFQISSSTRPAEPARTVVAEAVPVRPAAPRELTAEEVLRMPASGYPTGGYPGGMYPGGGFPGGYPSIPMNPPMPAWMAREEMMHSGNPTGMPGYGYPPGPDPRFFNPGMPVDPRYAGTWHGGDPRMAGAPGYPPGGFYPGGGYPTPGYWPNAEPAPAGNSFRPLEVNPHMFVGGRTGRT